MRMAWCLVMRDLKRERDSHSEKTKEIPRSYWKQPGEASGVRRLGRKKKSGARRFCFFSYISFNPKIRPNAEHRERCSDVKKSSGRPVGSGGGAPLRLSCLVMFVGSLDPVPEITALTYLQSLS